MHTRTPSLKVLRLSDLSIQRQLLVRLCQQTNYGAIRGLEIREREPVFDPAPVVQIDLKLDADDPPRPEMVLRDFELSQEVIRLLERVDDGFTTMIELLEVRAGIPRRVVFRAFPVSVSDDPNLSAGGVPGPPEAHS